jgi:hypothetical protein
MVTKIDPDETKEGYEVPGYGTATPSKKGIVFRLNVDGDLITFIAPFEKNVETFLASVDSTLKELGLDKSQKKNVMKAIAETVPKIANYLTPRQKIYAPAWFVNGTCYEAVKIDNLDCFLFWDGSSFQVAEFVESDSCQIMPVQFASPYVFDSVPDHVPQVGEIYKDVLALIKDYFVHPDSRTHKFLALYLMHSYILTKSLGTIFLWLIGGPRTGKTTVQLIAGAIGYRPFSGVATSEAALYRTLGYEVEYAPLIIIKEFERASDLMKEIAREGDIPGSPIYRADKESDGKLVVRGYHSYGSRVVASNKLHGDEADMDRYHVLKTVKSKPVRPRSELYRNKEVMKKMQRIRNNLLLWKIANHAKLEIPPTNEVIKDGRDWEHYGGIITLASMISADLEQEITEYVKEYLKRKEQESEGSVATMLRKLILTMYDEKDEKGEYIYRIGDNLRISSEELWARFQLLCSPYYDKNGEQSSYKALAPDGRMVSTISISKLVREQLLGSPTKWREGEKSGIRGFEWSKEDINVLKGLVAGVADVAGLEAYTEEKMANNQDNETENKQQENFAQLAQKAATPATPATPLTASGKSEEEPKKKGFPNFVAGVAGVAGLEAYTEEKMANNQDNETENKQQENFAQLAQKCATPATPPTPLTASGKLGEEPETQDRKDFPKPLPDTILTVCIRCGQVKPCQWQGEGQDRHAICEECLGRHREL